MLKEINIPDHVRDAACLLTTWAETNDVSYWRLEGVADRRQLEAYEQTLLGLGVTHMLSGPQGPEPAALVAVREDNGEPVGITQAEAGAGRWYMPLVKHDGSPVMVRVVLGVEGKRRMSFMGPFTPLKIGA